MNRQEQTIAVGTRVSGRQESLDLLRVLSTVAVVVIHIVCFRMWRMEGLGVPDEFAGHYYHSVMTVLFRFGTPCFIMLSGAFLLGRDLWRAPWKFWRKSLVHIWLPFAVVSVLYCVMDANRAAEPMSWALLGDKLSYLWHPSESRFHLWYMYMLVGLYLLLPLLCYVRSRMSLKWLTVLAMSLLVVESMAGAGGWEPKCGWKYIDPVLCCVLYLGYLMMGHCLRQWAPYTAKYSKVLLLVAVVLLGIWGTYYGGMVQNLLRETELTQFYASRLSYGVVVPVLLLFLALCGLVVRLPGWVKFLVPLSYVWYLVHVFFMRWTEEWLAALGGDEWYSPAADVVQVLLVCAGSIAVAWLYQWVEKRVRSQITA